jgi:hypothetical protein
MPEALQRTAPKLLDLLFLSRIGRHRKGHTTQALTFLYHLVEHLCAARREHDRSTALGKGVSGGAADAAGRAGDHGDEMAVLLSHV